MIWARDEEVLRPVRTFDPSATAGRLDPSEVDFSGAGQSPSGKSACTAYITTACEAVGVPVDGWMPGMLTIALRESSYNSPASQINLDDSNSRIGAPVPGDSAHPGARFGCSRGGWQCIPTTFAGFHAAGTSTSIYDPVANCAAAINYIIHDYKVSRDGHDLMAKVAQADPNGPGGGY
ncbi:hypothetical protein [Kitasatospora sp. McL0602]|uniref:hypothetical protein n=1 Tax=Kitasatospora sp. McL0602 TaxID=3439530 RepID=UPI003F8BD620